MNHLKRQSLRQLGALGLTLAAWPHTQANGPSRVLVPFQPGGISSILARTLATELNKIDQKTWTLEHAPGYSNMTAVKTLLQAADQGQWDVMITGPTVLTLGNSMNPFMSVRADQDLKVLLGLIQGPMILVSHVTSGLDTWQKVQHSQRRLRIGVSGLGSPAHFVAAHIDQSVMPLGDAYNTEGDLPSMVLMAKGELDLAVISIGSCLPPLNKDYNALLTSGAQAITWRDNIVIPTMASAGQTPEARQFQFNNWLSVCVSAKMPPPMQWEITDLLRKIKAAGGLDTTAKATFHQVMNTAPDELMQQIIQSRALLEEYILSAELSNTLGLELTQ